MTETGAERFWQSYAKAKSPLERAQLLIDLLWVVSENRPSVLCLTFIRLLTGASLSLLKRLLAGLHQWSTQYDASSAAEVATANANTGRSPCNKTSSLVVASIMRIVNRFAHY